MVPDCFKKGRRITRAGFSLAVVLLFLGLLELAGRLAVPATSSDPARLGENQLVSDPELGWALPASSTLLWLGQRVTTNSLGLRGHEPRAEADFREDAPAVAGTAGPSSPTPWRILVTGDSTVFGHGVPDRQTMPQNLENLLREDLFVDVQNGGVPGYTCVQSRRLVHRISQSFPPDLLLVYSMHSDRRVALSQDQIFLGTGLGILGQTGTLRLAQWLAYRLRSSGNWPTTPVERYESCLRRMWREQEARGGQTGFILPIVREDLLIGMASLAPETGAVGTRLADYRQAMIRVARDTDSILVDLPACFRAKNLSDSVLMLDEVHLNGAGQAMAAEAIKTALEQHGLF